MQYLSTPWLLIAILSASFIVVAILWYLNAPAHNFRVDAAQANIEPLRLATFLFRDEKLSDSDCILHKCRGQMMLKCPNGAIFDHGWGVGSDHYPRDSMI